MAYLRITASEKCRYVRTEGTATARKIKAGMDPQTPEDKKSRAKPRGFNSIRQVP